MSTIDESLTKTKAQVDADTKAHQASAFPGRYKAMGYSTGLSKLEWIVTNLIPAMPKSDIADVVSVAKNIIKACEEQK